MTWVTILRSINGCGCIVALYLLGSAFFHQWRDWNFKTRQHWFALVGWTFLGMEGSFENLIFHTQPGPRLILQTLVVAWTIRALTIHEKLESDPAIPWKRKN